jgi:hypothetical protein
MWDDPFTPVLLNRAREHRADLRQIRLQAEEAEEHLYRARSLGGDPATLDSLLVGSRMLDYTCMRYLYAVEIADTWEHQRQQKEPPEPLWEIISSGITCDDLMDEITELRRIYRANWLAEYTPYRLGKALGRWDAEYEYWRGLQARFRALQRGYKTGDPLPPLESIVKAR